jgi:dipeptidyl aminopeptidase/acylaminoacyl peptidase
VKKRELGEQNVSEVQDASRDTGFRPADLLRQRVIDHLAVSPDGSLLAFGVRTIERGQYRTRLFVLPVAGGRPEPLAAVGRSDERPRFSPDGRSLLVLSDRDGVRRPWVIRLDGGKPRPLGELPGPARAAEWSPDGRHVLALAPAGERRFAVGPADDPTAFQISDLTWRANGVGIRDRYTCAFTLPVGGGRAQRLTDPTYEVAEAFWCGRDAVGFLADLGATAAEHEFPQAWQVPVQGGEPQLLLRLRGAVYAAACSAGGQVAVLGINRPGAPTWANVTLHTAEAGLPRRLAPRLRFPIARANWTDLLGLGPTCAVSWVDDTHLVALVTVEGAVVPYLFDLDGFYAPLIAGTPVCSLLATGGGRVAVVAAEGGSAGEVCMIDEGRLRPLTRAGSAWLGRPRMRPERLRIRRPEGHKVDGWLTRSCKPQASGALVLHIHGGPNSAHGQTPWLEMLALAEAGIHVLAANPRGSAGYGEGFARAVYGRWGDPDGEDVLALVEAAIECGLADRARIGVLGTSYGGFLVNWLLGRFPGHFAAAVSENPITDQPGFFGSSAMGPLSGKRHTGLGTLPDDLDAFLARSPYLRIAQNKAPLLLLHAEQDLTCPIAQSELVFTILRAHGRPVEFVRYPAEDHDLLYAGRPDRRVDRLERIVDWFTRHLLEPSAVQTPRRRESAAGSRS